VVTLAWLYLAPCSPPRLLVSNHQSLQPIYEKLFFAVIMKLLYLQRRLSILVKEKSTAKIAETGEHVCLKMCLPFTHSPVSETSPCRVKIFTIKWSLKANLVGRIRILFILRSLISECRVYWPFPLIQESGWTATIRIFVIWVRLNRPIGISCEVISPSGYYTSNGISVNLCFNHSSLHVQGYRHCPGPVI
jgi:hypothetical protein